MNYNKLAIYYENDELSPFFTEHFIKDVHYKFIKYFIP